MAILAAEAMKFVSGDILKDETTGEDRNKADPDLFLRFAGCFAAANYEIEVFGNGLWDAFRSEDPGSGLRLADAMAMGTEKWVNPWTDTSIVIWPKLAKDLADAGEDWELSHEKPLDFVPHRGAAVFLFTRLAEHLAGKEPEPRFAPHFFETFLNRKNSEEAENFELTDMYLRGVCGEADEIEACEDYRVNMADARREVLYWPDIFDLDEREEPDGSEWCLGL